MIDTDPDSRLVLVRNIRFGYDDSTGEGGTYPFVTPKPLPEGPVGPLQLIGSDSAGDSQYTDTDGFVWKRPSDIKR